MKYTIKLRKAISFLIMIGIAVGLLLIFAQAETVVDVSVNKLKVTYVYDSGGVGDALTMTPGNGTLNTNVKTILSSWKYYSGTVTIKLTSEYSRAKLSFDWSGSASSYGTISVNGNESASGKFEQTLDKGDTIVIKVKIVINRKISRRYQNG